MPDNAYKKKLANASLKEAQAMDNAYTNALNKKLATYTHDGLEYAVRPGQSRVYAADIVKGRTPSKPTTPVQQPVVPKPKVPIPDTTRTNQSNVKGIVVKSTAPSIPTASEEPVEKLSPTTMGGASSTRRDYASLVKKVEPAFTPMKKPSSTTATESTKVAPQTYGKKKDTSTQMTYASVIGDMFTTPKNAKIDNKEEGFIEKAVKAISDPATIKQAARKYGLIDDSKEATTTFNTPATKKPIEIQKGKGYKLETVRDTTVFPIEQDKNNPASWRIDENNPDIKARYSYVGNRAERIKEGTKDIPNAKVVSDFLLDESFTSGYKHPYAQNFHNALPKAPNQLVAIATPDNKGTYTTKVKPYGELTTEEKAKGKIKQLRTITLSELEKTVLKGDKVSLADTKGTFSYRGVLSHAPNTNFPIPGEPDTKGKTVPLSSQNKLGAFSGAAVTIAYKDKDGTYKHERLNGSINQIITRARQLKQETGADPTLMLADVGSFSNKPVANKDNVLTAEQQMEVNSYNTDDYGGAMEILRGDKAKAYKFKGLNGARDTTVITSNPNNKFVKQFAKPKLAMGGLIKKKLALGGTNPNYNNYAAYGQLAAQGVNMVDGMDGTPSYAGGIASGALSGASMGASFGLPGMAAGAVIGGGAAYFAAEKAKKAEAEANQRHMQNLTDMNKVTSKQTLRNYSTTGVTSVGHYAYGGNVQPEYEVEGNEVIQGQGVALNGGQQQLASDVHKAVGASHEEGGIDGKGGDRVFSDRLKHSSGKTYAQVADKLGKKKGIFESKLNSTNTAAKNTGKRMIERIDNELDKTFNEQEMKKLATQHAPLSVSSSKQKFGDGGGIQYSPNNPYKKYRGNFGVDTRTGLPANDVNQNGHYSGTEWNTANIMLPEGHGLNPYPYNVKVAPDASMYYDPKNYAVNNVDPSAPAVTKPTYSSTLATLPVTSTSTSTTGTNPANVKGNGTGSMLPWQFVDNLANGIATANTPKIPKPYLDPNVKLNTQFDINPQLSSARNTRDAVMKSINANTAQTGVSNANKQQLFATYNDTANNLYAQKFNVENELKNKEILVNQNINSDNNDKLFNHDVAQATRRGNIGREYANNASNFANDMYTHARDTKMDARDLEATKMIMAANPDSPQYLTQIQAAKNVFDNNPEMVDSMLANLPAGNPAAIWLKQRYKK